MQTLLVYLFFLDSSGTLVVDSAVTDCSLSTTHAEGSWLVRLAGRTRQH